MKTLIIYHRSDFDGTLSRDVCVHWLTACHENHIVTLGWEYGDPPPLAHVDAADRVFLVDISIAEVLVPLNRGKIVWIDHHKSAIEKFGEGWQGVRIDGVAACRLCWQYFQSMARGERMPTRDDFINRVVQEPAMLRLAGEYDVWDKRDPDADTLQCGLRAAPTFDAVAAMGRWPQEEVGLVQLLDRGRIAQEYARTLNIATGKRTYTVRWEGLNWLVLNTALGNSASFGDAVTPEHDGLLMWRHLGGDRVAVSLYGVPHHPEHDLSLIAVRRGGGGHRGACGFTATWKEVGAIVGGGQ